MLNANPNNYNNAQENKNRDDPTGKLSLVFRKKADGTTYVAKQYFKLPLQVMSPYYQDSDGTAFMYLLNPSGGILQHDRLYTEIELEENSKALVTTPSSTKLYKMDDGYAVLDNIMTVKAGAVLEYLPEHNVPFALSKTYQNNTFYLDSDATLISYEMVTAGRVSRGEIFQYDLYSSKTKIYVDGKLEIFDCSIIEPKKMQMDAIGMLEGNLSNANMYIYKKGLGNDLAKSLNGIKDSFEGVSFGATNINDSLLVIRFMGNNMINMQETLTKIWSVAREAVLEKPSVRIRRY